MSEKELAKVYEPHEVEKKWSEIWINERTFTADPSSNRPPFSMVIPPPNITGSLHMGHALNNTLQDAIARYKRLQGFDVLWVPGTDHAGIATQNVVEKKLHAEGSDRNRLGREEFIRRVWKWKEESGGTIVRQLKRLGCSCDWTRQEFTMSERLSGAVRRVFVTLHEKGLIYRDERLINWCPRCLTALSDIEVEHEDAAGKLYHIRYHIAGSDEFLTVATTRPETLLGDTAVAVHPEDERNARFIGKEVMLPLTCRRIPVVGDEMVDREFGTGCVKITPAHDFNDFEAGLRHKLPRIAIFDERAHVKADIKDVLPEVMAEVAGLHAHKAREKAIHILKERGFLTKTDDHSHATGRCYRCKTVVEPFLSPQWYVKTRPLADRAAKAVEDGKTKIVPKSWENTYFEWMRNIKDWCVSRQIWWGHRIPAWYCKDCNKGNWSDVHGELKFAADAEAIVSLDEVKRCPRCKGSDVVMETDVLDTWFSSALWPFSTLGWPEDTKELSRYYPTSALVTGFDIIFFWVARMMMMGLEFRGDVPFRDVYIHALVRDAEGQKMSKSKGNVIDPLSVMDQYGTDALRFTLAAFAAQGRDIKLAEERIEGYRNFANKIWNLTRFAMMNVNADERVKWPSEDRLSHADKWITSRLGAALEEFSRSMDAYQFDAAARALYSFVWHELCDWYVELIKPDLRGELGEERKQAAASVLIFVLRDTLTILNPFMPFITEELFSYLPGEKGRISDASFPRPRGDYKKEAAAMEAIMGVIRAVRNIRTEMNLSPAAEAECSCFTSDLELVEALSRGERHIKGLAKISRLSIESGGARPEKCAFSMAGGVEVFVPLKGLLDLDAETKRLVKELEKTDKEISIVGKKLSSEDFVRNAPPDIVEKERQKLESYREKRSKIEESMERIRGLA